MVGAAGVLGCIPATWLLRVTVATAIVGSWANMWLSSASMVCRRTVSTVVWLDELRWQLRSVDDSSEEGRQRL